MSDYDAIVVGAGHNGLTAAAVLQQAGLRTVCLEANTYTGGMAATVELIDGFRYEIAGSVQFPMPSQIAKELGLDTLPTVDAEVMSVNLGDDGEEPMIFYRDPMQFMTHLADKHGNDAVTGMAGLDRLEPGTGKGTRPLRCSHTAQDARRDVRVRGQRSRAHRDPRCDLRDGDGRHRPLPARQTQARRAAKHARLPRHQLHLPRALHPRQRNMFGVRACRSRRHHRDDDEAGRRHRCAVRSPAPTVRLERRRGQVPRQGGKDSRRRTIASPACVCATDPRSPRRWSFPICRRITHSSIWSAPSTCPPTSSHG